MKKSIIKFILQVVKLALKQFFDEKEEKEKNKKEERKENETI
jgi:hypothetical protein